MAKVVGPVISIGAKGKIGKSLIFTENKDENRAKIYSVPKDPKSSGQIGQRSYMAEAVNEWKTDGYSALDIAAWNFYAKIYKRSASGMNYFIKEKINVLKISDDWTLLKNCVVSNITDEGCIVTVDINSDKSGKLYLGISKYSMLKEFIGVFDTDHYTFTITGLVLSTNYFFYIKNTSIGEGARTGIFNVKTLAYVPPVPIDITMGHEPVAGTANWNNNATIISLENPANVTGRIKTIEVWGKEAGTGLKVGTFFRVSGNYFTTRDYAAIGAYSLGYNLFNVDIEVTKDDLIGLYSGTGKVGRGVLNPSGVNYMSGEHLPVTNYNFSNVYATFWLACRAKGIGYA